MIRAFIALSLPDPVTDALDDIQTDLRGANWTPTENMHVTLLFLGEQNRRVLEDVDAALKQVATPCFDVEFAGVGAFGGREARLVYAAIRENETLRLLQRKVETAVRATGVEVEDRRYTPHATLARWRRGEVRPEALQAYIEGNSLFRAPAFTVSEFHLYRSDLSRGGPTYTILASYGLRI